MKLRRGAHGYGWNSASTLDEATKRKAPKGGYGKGRYGKGRSVPCVKYHCKIGQHTSCTSLSCTCSCGHRGVNRV